MRDRGSDDDCDRELPGASPASRERAREPDQADAEGDREDSRRLRPSRRQDALHDVDAARHLRRQCRGEPDHTNQGGGPGEEPLCAGRTQDHGARVQRAHEGTRRASRRGGARGDRPDPAAALGDRCCSALVAVALVPWTLYLTFTLPSRHVTFHYDLAWVGFDVALAASFAATAWAASPRLALARPTRRRDRDDAAAATRGSTSSPRARAARCGRRSPKPSSPSYRSRRSARSSSTTPRRSSPRR